MLMKILNHPAMQLIIKCYETAIYAAGGFMLIHLPEALIRLAS